jgi:hypothetical protein
MQLEALGKRRFVERLATAFREMEMFRCGFMCPADFESCRGVHTCRCSVPAQADKLAVVLCVAQEGSCSKLFHLSCMGNMAARALSRADVLTWEEAKLQGRGQDPGVWDGDLDLLQGAARRPWSPIAAGGLEHCGQDRGQKPWLQVSEGWLWQACNTFNNKETVHFSRALCPCLPCMSRSHGVPCLECCCHFSKTVNTSLR